MSYGCIKLQFVAGTARRLLWPEAFKLQKPHRVESLTLTDLDAVNVPNLLKNSDVNTITETYLPHGSGNKMQTIS